MQLAGLVLRNTVHTQWAVRYWPSDGQVHQRKLPCIPNSDRLVAATFGCELFCPVLQSLSSVWCGVSCCGMWGFDWTKHAAEQ
jgi:hypothetical protein